MKSLKGSLTFHKRAGNFPDRAAVPPHRGKSLLIAECVFLFFILPATLYFWRNWLAFKVIPLVLVLALIGYLLLRKDATFNLRALWVAPAPLIHMKSMLIFLLPAALAIVSVSYVFLPERFLMFPRAQPERWLVFIILYPLVAAYPQELIFRTFFFHRYKDIFPGDKSAIVGSALSFSLAHSLYFNWVAFGLTFLGGILFSWRYLKSGSLVLVAVEHGLWGNLLFTTGLGWYLYSGAIR